MRRSRSRVVRDLALHALRALGCFALAQYLTRKRLRILCYHGLSQGDEHLYLPYMFVHPETFEARLRILRRRGISVMTLDEAVRKLGAGRLDRACAVLTFDDGWESNLTVALPILERHGVPACVYVTTEHLDAGPEAFNVILLYMLLRSRRMRLELTGVHPSLDGAYDFGTDPHRAAIALIERAEAALPLTERQRLLAPIAAALGLNVEEVLSGGRFRLVDRRAIEELARRGVEVEMHTHTHHLPDLSFEAMRQEIEDNRRILREITGREPRHFCYPSGLYSTRHPAWLRQLGILSATTCEAGLNDQRTSPMLLKRYLDNDQTSNILFEAQVCGLHDLLSSARRFFRRQPAPA